jgi:signal transduction histidine kinase
MEEERIRIAREIHDELGQILTAADIELAGVHKEISDNRPAAEKISAVSELIGIAIEDVQRICSELRPRVLDHLGLIAALEWQADEFSKRSGIICGIKTPKERTVLSPEVSTTIFRIFQETLTNAARHSGATEVRATLSMDEESITLEVSDNGRGIPVEKLADSDSLGIIGTRERAQELGGTVRYKGIDGTGTTVTAKIPLKKRGVTNV